MKFPTIAQSTQFISLAIPVSFLFIGVLFSFLSVLKLEGANSEKLSDMGERNIQRGLDLAFPGILSFKTMEAFAKKDKRDDEPPDSL